MTEAVKYPRTLHLPWSPGVSDDDKVMKDVSVFSGREIVITEKMDGENTTMYSDYIHARSLSWTKHESRTWIKAIHDEKRHNIPSGWRVCGENVAALHSIPYEGLASYFLVFSIWTDKNECLSWDDTVEWCELMEFETVPVLYRGPWNEDFVRSLAEQIDLEKQEGYVVRTVGGFSYEDFGTHVAKWVRKGHVQTDEHWLSKPPTFNGLLQKEVESTSEIE